jgi:hypothetical protein
LWCPILLKIDTQSGEYYLKLKGLVALSAEGDPEEIIRLKLNVFFMKFTFYPLQKSKDGKHKKLASKRKSNPRKGIALKKIWRMLRTFKVKTLLVDLDTGDYTLNARLYPVFMLLNATKATFRINFADRNRLALQIQNRPIYILKSFINL